MTPTPREISLERIMETLKLSIHRAENLNDIAYDISALLEEARQQGREEMKKEFIKFVKEETSFPKIRLLDRKDLLNFLSL